MSDTAAAAGLDRSASPRASWPARAVTAVLGLGVILLVLRGNPLPEPVPASAPVERFSAGRAREHLRFIGAEPHALGMPRHAAVRDYLQARLRDVGAEVQLQREAVFAPAQGIPRPAANVENVVGRLRAKDGAKGTTVMLVAHYDSVPTGPGASDNGAAVASILEVARALQQGPALAGDVLFLFTDAEEQHLLGSTAFVASHPWARETGVVLNVDARGNAGPLLMFEVSPGGGWLVRRLAEEAPDVGAGSLFTAVYQRMKNATDFTALRQGGWQGLNFANVEGTQAYHTRQETVDEVSDGLLQQQGDTLLALTRRISREASVPEGEELIYFNAGPLRVHYPRSWAVPLAAFWGLLFVFVVVRARMRKQLRLWAVLRESVVLLLVGFLASSLARLAWPLLKALQPGFRALSRSETQDNARFILAVVLWVMAVMGIGLFLRRRAPVMELAVGGCVPWAVIAILVSVVLPGASALFLWPLAGMVLLLLWLGSRRTDPLTPWRVPLWGLAALPLLVLLPHVLATFFTVLPLERAAVPSDLLMLAICLLAPGWLWLAGRGLPWASGGAVLLGLGLLVSLAVGQRFDARHPRPTGLLYLVDADARSARWVSSDAVINDWTRAYLGSGPKREAVDALPEVKGPFWTAPAPAPGDDVRGPVVDARVEAGEGGRRKVSLHITPSRPDAAFVDVQVLPGDAVVSARLAGQSAPGDALRTRNAAQGVLLRYWVPSAGGFDLELELTAGGSPTVRVGEHAYAVPAPVTKGLPARPEDTMPVPFGEGLDEGTRVTRTLPLISTP
ncbi:M20/M25/M40 family metallo-hydrolase [Corallococcus aberystwythensis]|uniref:M20/M25/M40 family metallo-hydrolase n=1 Tax=Corallococcus aberystwythensis TaxID=2316722 RepID=A0A3A8R158_9BACT|nr:M20/M25/M40 family metallo-hydrolase [Corallococcus aberystwythensis]RKH72930.1 M20/M25/M40 family metallo-hydrolase [Corallococcus aberystwythensis]